MAAACRASAVAALLRRAPGGGAAARRGLAAASEEAKRTWKHYSQLSRTDGHLQFKGVNRRYVPPMGKLDCPKAEQIDNSMGKMSDKHLREEWTHEEVAKAVQDNVVMTWTGSSHRGSLPHLVRGEGVYLYDSKGNQYMDFTSQAVCTNMGYTLDEDVKNAVVKQMEELFYVYPGMGIAPIRAKLCSLLAEITPGDINGFLFPLGGSEANEGAIRIARRYTGKFKIMSAMRSYHGGTTGPLAATGDFRTRFAGEQPGFVKIFNPQALRFTTGASDEAAAEQCLRMLEEQIICEGPGTIAAILLETIVGANGVFLHPVGYLEGVRALCDKYGILLILDEVMCGFWRTGPLFAFMHFPGVIPDILTSAKGLTSSILPLGMIGMRQKIKDHFETNPLGWGATYANHPVLLACAYNVVKKNVQMKLEQRVAEIEQVLLREMDGLVARHKCVLQGRAIGAFGCLDLVNKDGVSLNLLGDVLPPEALVVKESLAKNGLFGLFRSPMLHICPALVMSDAELKDMFGRLDRLLSDLDAALDA